MSRKRKDPDALKPIPLYAQCIRDLREDHDLKQRQIAEYLNISQRTYADYELGNIRIPVDALIALAGQDRLSDRLRIHGIVYRRLVIAAVIVVCDALLLQMFDDLLLQSKSAVITT